MRIRCPDGTEGDVKVPKNLKAGDDFIFEMTGVNEDKVREMSRQLEEYEKSGKRRHLAPQSIPPAGNRQAGELSAAGQQGPGSSSFLDREIINRQDFLTALAIGMLIGLSIVGGFLAGILLVTDPSEI